MFHQHLPRLLRRTLPHIHFEVYPDQASSTDASRAVATSQVALPKSTCDTVYAQPGYESSVANLAQVTVQDDTVFGDDDGVRQLGSVTGDITSGYTVSLDVGVDTTTTPTGGQRPGDDGAGGPGRTPPSGPPPGPRPSGAPSSR